jgi:PAS domain S-box-containing protein
MNKSLEQCVATSTNRQSVTDVLLASAREDERLAAVAFETHDSIVITDKEGKILRVNKSFTEMTGYTAEDVVGMSPRVLKSGRHDAEFYDEMWQTIRAQGYWQGELERLLLWPDARKSDLLLV